jgi:hypothetical protein
MHSDAAGMDIDAASARKSFEEPPPSSSQLRRISHTQQRAGLISGRHSHRLLCLCACSSAAVDHDETSPAAGEQLAVSSEPPPQKSLRRHKEKAQPRLVGMGEKPLVLAQLRSEDYLSYYASSYSKARREEPPAQKKAISNHRFMLQFSDAHDHVCIWLAERCSAVI